MNDTSRGIGASLLIHGALLGVFVMLNTVWVAERPRVKIDLGILRSAGGPPAPAPAKRRPAAQPAVQPAAVSAAAAPSPDAQEYPGPPAPSADADSGGTGTDTASAGSPDEAAQRNAYISEYFLFIKERIVKNLVFPPAARRMGWSGKVLVSFVVCRDGQVSEIRIVESTGYPLLDRSVVETIRKVSPFPKAPVEAELTMPIVYRLL